MKKLTVFSILLLTFSYSSYAAIKRKNVKKTESQKMKVEIDRIEKRVNELNQNIEDYKKAEKKLDELEQKYFGDEQVEKTAY